MFPLYYMHRDMFSMYKSSTKQTVKSSSASVGQHVVHVHVTIPLQQEVPLQQGDLYNMSINSTLYRLD